MTTFLPTMRVVVITPAYQAEATLGTALASVRCQTRPPDEVVIADDGSTDATAELARGWARFLPVTVVTTERNAGPAAARRLAIESSSSDLIALLDADDVWLPDHLESMLAAYDTTDDGLSSADTRMWIPGAGLSRRTLSDRAPLPPDRDQLLWLLRDNYLSISSLFSRSRYEAVGGFRPQFRGTEDWDLWIRMVRAGAVVVRPDHPTVLYRLTPGNVSGDDALVRARADVLAAARREGGAEEHRVLRAAIRRNGAATQLFAAYAAAERGEAAAARLAGLRAARGIRPVAARGLAMAVAPRWVARRRRALRYEPGVWMRRYGA
ncbi:MAG TPA: glycosyltransferase family A protein [Acidimicrobiales bacterium]|nr:glycosyltransferase family A protein [Acidimicrobiales bacterium]